jgi:hypothetical protein
LSLSGLLRDFGLDNELFARRCLIVHLSINPLCGSLLKMPA